VLARDGKLHNVFGAGRWQSARRVLQPLTHSAGQQRHHLSQEALPDLEDGAKNRNGEFWGYRPLSLTEKTWAL